MDICHLIQRMEILPTTIDAMVAGLPESDWHWRPAEGGWSILEIVCHLVDEETTDFRVRIQITLQQDGRTWPSIDPEQAAIDRDYQNQSIPEQLARLQAERAASLEWLRQLQSPDWNAAYQHPTLGTIKAGDLMAAWAAHDALHIRQIAKRIYQLTLRDTAEFTTAYAGEWKA